MGIFDFWKRDVLFWPGCYSLATNKDVAKNYRRILRRLGITTTAIDKISCCAGVLIDAGYDKESRKIARDNMEILRKRGIKRIITSCPLCCGVFSRNYKQMLPEWDIKINFILSVILERLKESPELIEKQVTTLKNKIVYKDSCSLGRGLHIYEEPREILKRLGYEIIELQNNREDALCCGTCGNLKFTNKSLSNKICQEFIEKLKRTKINRLVVADYFEYQHLKENLRDTGIEVVDFSEILCDALGIWKL